jgi:hypothetical protein
MREVKLVLNLIELQTSPAARTYNFVLTNWGLCNN